MLPPEVIEIEQKMENYEKLYLNTISDFVKWTTAFAAGAILWFGNFLIPTTLHLTWYQLDVAILSLFCFFVTIISSILIFYCVSQHWNGLWVLNFRHRRSLLTKPPSTAERREVNQEAIDIASEKSSDKPIIIAKKFNISVIIHMVFLILGFCLFIWFIFLIKESTILIVPGAPL